MAEDAPGLRGAYLRGMLRDLWARVARRDWLVPSREKSGPAKIAIQGVGHRYQDVEALKNVNIDIHPGEFVCLLGPSGCGKSTLLYALAGHVTPGLGRIAIDGEPIHGPSPERLLMYQEPALFPWLTVKQNLVFALRAKKLSRRDAQRRALDFTQRVYLQGYEDLLPHQLSGGMRMRVSLARALAMDPSVLLMDEPFAALDAQTRSDMHQLLTSIWMQTKKTVVFVTHNVREALVLADRVVVMTGRPGRIVRDLEVRLPRPRDPDDERVVHLSRTIRPLLSRTAFSSEEPSTGREHEDVEPHATTVTPRVATGGLGGGG